MANNGKVCSRKLAPEINRMARFCNIRSLSHDDDPPQVTTEAFKCGRTSELYGLNRICFSTKKLQAAHYTKCFRYFT